MRTRLLVYANRNFSTWQQKVSQDNQKIIAIGKPQKKIYFTNSIFSIIHSSMFMFLPSAFTDIQHLMSLRVSAVGQSTLFWEYGLAMGKWGMFFALLGSLTYYRRFNILDLSNRIGIRMRSVLFKRILNSDMYKKNAEFQSYLHHMMADVQQVSNFMGDTIFFGLRGIFFLIGGISCLLYQSPLICLIAAVTMTGFNLFYKPRNQKLKDLKQKQNLELIQLSEHIAERIHNIRLVKVSHTEAVEKLKLSKAIDNYYGYAKDVAKAYGFNYASLQALGLFSLVSIVGCGSLLVSLEISNFSLLASSTYAVYVALGFRSLVFFNTDLMRVMGVYKIIEDKIGNVYDDVDYGKDFDKMEEEYERIAKKIAFESEGESRIKSSGMKIRIQNLSFDYGLQNSKMYENFNQTINSGDVVALVGPSGVGKSTLLNLLTKLSSPTHGNIYFDDMPLSLMTFQDIQQKVSYVTQENLLFRGTLEDNLSYGNQGFDCSKENLQRCLKLTNAYDFTHAKGGLQMLIDTKGSNLSGGQKQRIIIARALVKRPKLLLLDEATAGIDSDSQKIIIQSLKGMGGDMTTVIITHKIDNFRPMVTRYIVLEGK